MRSFVRALALGIGAPAAVAACKPDLNLTDSIVTGPRILAVRVDPAEGAPRARIQYTALYVDATGPIPGPPLEWAFCNARKPLAQLGPVNPDCLQASGDWFVPIGVGSSVGGALPDIACRQFGPEVPEPLPHQPRGRPVDPDPTGGYYQPVRLLGAIPEGDAIGITETRLSCGISGATPDQAAQFLNRYRPNVNPAVESLTVVADAPLAMDDHGSADDVHASEHLALRVAWAECPLSDRCGDGLCGPDETSASCPRDCTTPKGCAGAERYVAFDLGTRTLTDQREAVHVSWFATGGSFDLDRAGRAPTDLATTSDNGWRAPNAPGTVHLWVVLQDDRGGTGWGEYVLDVH
jgi:hypothetical protein